MKNLLKRLFCKHIYKVEREEFLETKREANVIPGDLTTYSTYSYYALYKKCLKCGKEKITAKRTLHI